MQKKNKNGFWHGQYFRNKIGGHGKKINVKDKNKSVIWWSCLVGGDALISTELNAQHLLVKDNDNSYFSMFSLHISPLLIFDRSDSLSQHQDKNELFNKNVEGQREREYFIKHLLSFSKEKSTRKNASFLHGIVALSFLFKKVTVSFHLLTCIQTN